ncbi:MAG: cyclic nucleotide-binding domain-containing protein [Actinobacteria bacterium]|nr:cyclic nucleotide-binding domain-containing protein [Actinomycetota bacterium]
MDWLTKVDFFSGFEPRELQRVLSLSSEVEAPAGTILIDQGDAGTHCFVVVDGSVAIYIGGEYVTSVAAGSMVGEMSLIDHRPRNASVVVEEDAKLLRFQAPQFRQLLDEMPKASERVMTLLHKRLAGEATSS